MNQIIINRPATAPATTTNNMKIFKLTQTADDGQTITKQAFYPTLTQLCLQEDNLPVSKATLDRATFPYHAQGTTIEKFEDISFDYKSSEDLNDFLYQIAQILKDIGHPTMATEREFVQVPGQIGAF